MACGAIINVNNAGLPPDLDDVTLNYRRGTGRRSRCPDHELKFENLTLTYATQIPHLRGRGRQTGVHEIVDYAAVDDCGTRIHPQIVEGQVHDAGARARRGGGRSLRRGRDALTSNFYDYHVPHALDMPPLKTGFIGVAVAVQLPRDKGHGRGRRRPGIHAVCAALQDAAPDSGTRS